VKLYGTRAPSAAPRLFQLRRRRADLAPGPLRPQTPALRPGGIFVFEAALPTRRPPEGVRRHWTEGPLRRREEAHTLRLHPDRVIFDALETAGFEPARLESCGRFGFPEGIAAWCARRP